MNRQEQDILNILAGGTFSGQRELAEESGYSLGVVNRCLRSLTETGYVRADGTLTQNGQALLAENRPQRAVILAAGFGMRMVPPRAFCRSTGNGSWTASSANSIRRVSGTSGWSWAS